MTKEADHRVSVLPQTLSGMEWSSSTRSSASAMGGRAKPTSYSMLLPVERRCNRSETSCRPLARSRAGVIGFRSRRRSANAKQLYKRSYEENLLRRKSLDVVIGVCIFVACRQAHVPRTFGEISKLTRVSKTTLGQCHKALEQAFNLSPRAHDRNSSASPSRATGAEALLDRFCNHLDLPLHSEAICGDVIRRARDQSIGDGRSPISVAGGAIYFTSHLLGKEISQLAGVSESTVKLMYRIYFGYKERLVKKKWVESGKAKVENLPDERSHR